MITLKELAEKYDKEYSRFNTKKRDGVIRWLKSLSPFIEINIESVLAREEEIGGSNYVVITVDGIDFVEGGTEFDYITGNTTHYYNVVGKCPKCGNVTLSDRILDIYEIAILAKGFLPRGYHERFECKPK